MLTKAEHAPAATTGPRTDENACTMYIECSIALAAALEDNL